MFLHTEKVPKGKVEVLGSVEVEIRGRAEMRGIDSKFI